MDQITHKVMAYDILPSALKETESSWDLYSFFTANYLDEKLRKLTAYIPNWLYTRLKETRMEQYDTTVFKALSKYFNFIGTISEGSSEHILVVRINE